MPFVALKVCLPLFDIFIFVIHVTEMPTTVRSFLRNFAAHKAQARKGEVIRVQDREGEFVFTAVAQPRSLVGAARGKIEIHDDLTQPTLTDKDWQPNLG